MIFSESKQDDQNDYTFEGQSLNDIRRSSSSNATRRELVEHFVRTVNATVASDDRSEAFSFGSLFKDISSVGSIIGDGVSIFDDLLGG